MSGLYILVFALGGYFYKKRQNVTNQKYSKIAVFIPAYKEDAVIVDVAKTALKQEYPSKYFDVIVIADSLKKQTLQKLERLSIKVVEVAFESSTKAKALNTAMARLDDNYDHALILDADNIMEDEFLNKINNAFQNGYQVVQGHRKAKNLNTSFAILDAASEEINNHIFRKGHRALGLSSGLIGSGMAFEYSLFKTMMKSIKAVGGFDKELEFELAKKKISIEYLQDAIVLDEKIQKSSDFSTQRKRWLATQFIYLRRYFAIGCKQFLFNQNMNLFDKVWQMVIPPRLLLLGLVFMFALLYSILEYGFGYTSVVAVDFWLANLIVVIGTFFLSLPGSFYNLKTLKAMLSIPSAFLRMLLLLFKLKGANKKFIHTSHGVIKN
ncbi:glycosyltransferase [Flavobacteriaceae bacterium R38]|nr:glycosyltransferase [Flavobacteriaceae bacterium R38]